MTTNRERRYDANDTYFIQRQLESLDPATYYHLVPGVVGRRFIPPVASLSPNMPVYRYTMTKVSGGLKKSGRRAKDAPTVNVVKEEATHTIKTYRTSFSWELDEIRMARELGADLDRDGFIAAMTKIEQDFDRTLCVGDGDAVGLANHEDIEDTQASDKGSGQRSWLHQNADADEIIGDVRTLIAEATADLKQAQVPGSNMPMFNQFALFLPLAHYNHIDMRPRSSTSDTTILEFIKKFSALKSVIPWWRLDTADEDAPMAVLVPALDDGTVNPQALGSLLPLDHERLSEQYSGETTTVPIRGKCGGVANRYPIACRYLRDL